MGKSQTAAPPTASEVLMGLVVGSGDPQTEEMMADAGCAYLDALEVASLGLAEFVRRQNQEWAHDRTHTHAVQFTAFLAHFASVAGAPADEETMLAMIGAYVDHVHELDTPAEPGTFLGWLFDTFLGESEVPDNFEVVMPSRPAAAPSAVPDGVVAAPAAKPKRARAPKKAEAAGDMPGQQALPFEPTAPAPPTAPPPPPAVAAHNAAVKAGEKLPDLTGKTIKYRKGKEWVVGTVTAGAGPTIAFTAEDGDPWSNVDRKHCKVVVKKKKKAVADADDDDDDAVVAAPPAPLPDLAIAVPPKAARKYDRLLADPDSFVVGKPADEALAYYEVDEGAYKVSAEVTNGTPGENGVYLDVYVTKGGHGGPTFELPPARTLAGRYEIMLGTVPRTLVISAS